jgi:LAO/AO transport system kinase
VTDRLAEQVLAGRRRAIARAISLVENDGGEAQSMLADLHPHTGRAHIVGVTGPPGSGKSTLVNALALHFRQSNAADPLSVGIVAVDPTSPFSGGAILGDRIRMRDLAGDRGIFIRSMASRGNLGGLAWATADAIKAGILEIADVFVVNKADLEGADHAVMALRMMLDLNTSGARTVMHYGRLMEAIAAAHQTGKEPFAAPPWRPPIYKTVATRREGIEELAEAILAHGTHLKQTGGLVWRERERAAAELETIIQQESLRNVLTSTDGARLAALIDQIVQRELDPYTAGQELLDGLGSR